MSDILEDKRNPGDSFYIVRNGKFTTGLWAPSPVAAKRMSVKLWPEAFRGRKNRIIELVSSGEANV